MKRRIVFGAALAAALSGAVPAARADVLVGCETLTTIGAWGIAGGCALGDMIFTLGRTLSSAAPILIDFDTANGVSVLTTTAPDVDALLSAFSYRVTIDAASSAHIIEVQLFGIRQDRALANQGGAVLSADSMAIPPEIPVVVDLAIGNNAIPEASPKPLGAPPPPPDPSLFDRSVIDATSLDVVTRFNAVGNARDGIVGLQSVTTVYVLSATDVPAPSSLALIASGLIAGVALRRRR